MATGPVTENQTGPDDPVYDWPRFKEDILLLQTI